MKSTVLFKFPVQKDTLANTATAHHEFLVCSYENNAAKEKKKNLSQFVIRIVLLTLDNKGVVSSYDCKSDIFMLSNAILLINSNKFSVKMLKRRGKKPVNPAFKRKFNK